SDPFGSCRRPRRPPRAGGTGRSPPPGRSRSCAACSVVRALGRLGSAFPCGRILRFARPVPGSGRVSQCDTHRGLMRTKDQVRREIWKAMEREGVSRFPGAEGRIPNFAGAKLAAEKLAAHRLWKRGRVIKANPDSPQTHARRLALEEGKTMIMAVPRLRDPHPFRV